ncbi:hypothetical protein CONCODRAFT_8931 [Conidiobolus coronatus NRRL 28638]|uniref:Uncharacterized protein n=1 Tax=Conidiobolus coronatus (strain ATCC 28846 / CBS 209.66 / NRRL 28638) TaxID=796925 RepID=A0A137P141_CONC2|nr:hypothetical protein CONCODRAFT_8931 [Conidiobolus coronatus NRRL 28638]|eukprot:KXN68722.1 hypothetical protein CONCODRAFT_8931 [Conidiobolus coronatus NRRL 28638]
MATQFVYMVNTSKESKQCKYTIRGPNDEVFKFQKSNWIKYNLVAGESKEIIKVNKDTPLNYTFKLKFLINSHLINMKLYCKPFSNHKIVGSYKDQDSGTSKDINWTWIPSKDSSGCFILTDNNNPENDQSLARMCGLSLEGLDSGMLCITQNTEEYFHQLILITSCLIWEVKR